MTSREKANANGYPDFLLVLRAFAGIVVVMIHVYGGMIVTAAQNEALWTVGTVSFTWLLSGAGQCGVYLFFAMSGYLMAKGFATARYTGDVAGALRFYWARFLRIYPMFAFYVLVMITLGRMNAPTGTQTLSVLAAMFAMQWHPQFGDWFPWFKHLWSIMTEFQFYLTVPLFALAGARFIRGRRAAWIAIVAIAAAGVALRASLWHAIGADVVPWSIVGGRWDERIQQPLYVNLDLFLCGMLLVRIVRPAPIRITRIRVGSFFAMIFAFYVPAAWVTHYALFTPIDVVRTFWAVALPTCSLAFALVAIVYAERLNAGIAANGRPGLGIVRGFAHLGTLTYGIYLWHLPFIALPIPFSRPFAPLPNLIVTALLTYGLATIVAQVTHDGIEVPFDRFKKWVPSFLGLRRAGLVNEPRA